MDGACGFKGIFEVFMVPLVFNGDPIMGCNWVENWINISDFALRVVNERECEVDIVIFRSVKDRNGL